MTKYDIHYHQVVLCKKLFSTSCDLKNRNIRLLEQVEIVRVANQKLRDIIEVLEEKISKTEEADFNGFEWIYEDLDGIS